MGNTSHQLIVSTRNVKKLEELESLLRGIQSPDGGTFTLSSAADRGVPEVEETGVTFTDNAILKAAAAFRTTGEVCLADDSGLVVDALDGAPGVYSARFSGPNATDQSNNEALLRRLADTPAAHRQAAFVCHLALLVPKGWLSAPLHVPEVNHPDVPAQARLFVFEGRVEGHILTEYRGDGGFGYDPLFLHVPTAQTFAELDAATKNIISHRGRALAKLRAALLRLWPTPSEPPQ